MKKKIKNIHSIFVQLNVAFFIVVAITGGLLIWTYSPNIKRELTVVSQNYMNDLSIAYGATLDNEIKKADGDATAVLKADNLYLKLHGVGIEGVESSYVYVVDADGIMLSHPEDGKIGKSVDNDVVKQYAKDLKEGKETKNGIVTYEYNGAQRYAAIYVSTYKEFILVVAADADEVLLPISKINRQGIFGLLIALVICSMIGFVLARIVVKPITQMTDLTIKLSEMDFTEKEMYSKLSQRKDEVGSMGRALSLLRMELANIIRQIREESSRLLDTAADINVSALETTNTMEQFEIAVNEIAQGATAQAEDTQKATENVVGIGNMVKEADEQVAELIEYAKYMKKSGMAATEILSQLDTVNGQAEEYIGIIAKQTETTNESAQKIHEAASMITEIAEETNLLSLNASIEAARAGEQGRGFAVVASQIQKLAEQSNDSAKQIGEIIRILIEDSEKAVDIMKDVKEIIQKQSEHVNRTKVAFDEIQDGVEQSISGMEHVSQKTKEMDHSRAGVIDVVQNLSAIAQENAASAEETSSSVKEVITISNELSQEAKSLEKISNEMEERMSVFKI